MPRIVRHVHMPETDRFFHRVTEDDLCVLLAWEAGEVSEGAAAQYLALDRVSTRDHRLRAIQRGKDLVRVMRQGEGGDE